MKRLLLFIIWVYKQAVSPYLGARCRFVPSCSDYFTECLQTKGVLRGSVTGVSRLLRCHPLGGHGFDPSH